MTKLFMIMIYLSAFFNTVVVNCAHPANWQNCSSDQDVWLWPEVHRGIRVLTGAEKPYEEEHVILGESYAPGTHDSSP